MSKKRGGLLRGDRDSGVLVSQVWYLTRPKSSTQGPSNHQGHSTPHSRFGTSEFWDDMTSEIAEASGELTEIRRSYPWSNQRGHRQMESPPFGSSAEIRLLSFVPHCDDAPKIDVVRALDLKFASRTIAHLISTVGSNSDSYQTVSDGEGE
jgi:hypothetical protein